ncbi:MAG: hypothetical protein LVQ95_05015 [Candidatus Micrarchaeales archaeon]|nr:hypothetical protein [Candidatus Micrarchaeales archaeon]
MPAAENAPSALKKTAPSAPLVGANQRNSREQAPSLLAIAIKESKDPDVAKLKEEIDNAKKARSDIIGRIKEARRKLGYKEAEGIAIQKLLEIEKGKDQNNEKRRKIGYLKRLKNKLEFKISTEAKSLAEEKDLVRKIEEINKELNEAYKSIRLERKSDFIKKDIEDYKKSITELEAKIAENDKQLDELYDKIRKLLGIERAKFEKQQQRPKRKPQQSPMQEINLEDIAVIKKKEKKAVEEDESA